MFCAYCGKQNANAFGYCNACGKPMVPIMGAAPGTAPAMSPYPIPDAPKTMHPLGWVAIIAAAGFGVFVAANWTVPSGTDAGPFRLGVFIGAMLPPLIVAFLAGGIKKWRSPNRFAVVFFIVGIAWAGMAWVGSQKNHETAEARIRRLVLEASGQQPIKKAFWAQDREFDDAIREQYRNMFRINKEYMQQVKDADVSPFAKIGTPESFADPAAFADMLKQVHSLIGIDLAQEQKVREVVDNLRHIIQTSSWSASDREDAMRGFNNGIAEPLARRQKAIAAEQAWVQSIDDIYDYAQRNHSLFLLSGGHLIVLDNKVRNQFNSKAQTMDDCHAEFLRQQEEFNKYQQDLFRKMGVNPKDVGLEE